MSIVVLGVPEMSGPPEGFIVNPVKKNKATAIPTYHEKTKVIAINYSHRTQLSKFYHAKYRTTLWVKDTRL